MMHTDPVIQAVKQSRAAWFSLAVRMDDDHKAEVTRRKFAKVEFIDNGIQAELIVPALRFDDLKGGNYRYVAMSFEPAGEVKAWITIGEISGITVASGDCISIRRVVVVLPSLKRM